MTNSTYFCSPPPCWTNSTYFCSPPPCWQPPDYFDSTDDIGTSTCNLLITVYDFTKLRFTRPKSALNHSWRFGQTICDIFVWLCESSLNGRQCLFLDSKEEKEVPRLLVIDADWTIHTLDSPTCVDSSGCWCLESWYVHHPVSIPANPQAVLMSPAVRCVPCSPTHGQNFPPNHTQPAPLVITPHKWSIPHRWCFHNLLH